MNELVRDGQLDTLSLELDWSEAGDVRAHCVGGETVSEDPNDACNVYSGRLRYTSRRAELDGRTSPYDDPDYVDVALARIELD